MELQIKVPTDSALYDRMLLWVNMDSAVHIRNRKRKLSLEKKILNSCHRMVHRHLRANKIMWRHWSIKTKFAPKMGFLFWIVEIKE